ncbi:psychosine receptor-like [Lineus longissimus]|uniref:psychosine receptor-like n=1 Tax=Lineus longissimus TaxID=88925 RepID=UPI00315DCFAF
MNFSTLFHQEDATPTRQTQIQQAELLWQYRVSVILWTYIPAILIIFGSITNATTILVLAGGKFGRASTRILLVSLSLSDTTVLYSGLLRQWIVSVFGIDVRTLHELSCPLHLFFTYISLQASSWIMMLVTLERVISVIFPLKSRVICTARATVIAVIFVTVTLTGLNSHILAFRRLQPNGGCYASGDYAYFWRYAWFWTESTVRFGFPALVVFICNCLIVRTVLRSSAKRREISDGPDESKSTSITVMLVTTSFVFLFLCLPSAIYFLIRGTMFSSALTQRQLADIRLWYTITGLLQYANNASNFIVYCISGTGFRMEVSRMIRRIRG